VLLGQFGAPEIACSWLDVPWPLRLPLLDDDRCSERQVKDRDVADTVTSVVTVDGPQPLRSSRSSWSRGAAAKGRKLHRVNVRVRQKQPTLPGYDEAFANCARSHRRPYAQCIGPKFAARQLS
jgi:hypothetical protein